MTKHATLKLATTLFVLDPCTFVTGCVDSLLGPETSGSKPAVVQNPFGSVQRTLLAPRAADLNGDGRVDASDIALFAQTLSADLNASGTVDAADAALMGAVLQRTPGDHNGDGAVDASDYAAYSYAMARADLNHDGVTDAGDVSAFGWFRGRGDVDGNGDVTSADLNVIRDHLGQEVSPFDPIAPIATL